MGWRFENKTNIWSDCMAKGHLPVAVAAGGSSLNLYCSECQKVWRIALAGKLASIGLDELSLLEDTVWKRKVLLLICEERAGR